MDICIRCNVAGITRHYAEYFELYLVFLYISCYISDILVTEWTAWQSHHTWWISCSWLWRRGCSAGVWPRWGGRCGWWCGRPWVGWAGGPARPVQSAAAGSPCPPGCSPGTCTYQSPTPTIITGETFCNSVNYLHLIFHTKGQSHDKRCSTGNVRRWFRP